MSLKDLTIEQHRNAERQEFARKLIKGDITNDEYATYLYNQFPQYELLEVCAMAHGIFAEIPTVIRNRKIRSDFEELWKHDEAPKLMPVVQEYLDHIMSIKEDPKKILAHVYVRHMGDLSGGQMIARKLPGSKLYYQFDGDVDQIKNKIRSMVDDSMAEEAKLCFNFATKLFEQLVELE